MAAKAPSVLIVDDNTEFADLLGTLITEQGLTPILAHSAKNAIVLARLYSPAAIVVDLLLPDMTGHKLIKELAKPNGPPICVITGVFKGQTQMEKVRSIARISAWYEKPFDTRVLVEQIVKLVGKAVVERVEHQKVEELTKDFDINILEPVEDGGISDSLPRVPKPQSGPAATLEIEADDGEGIEIEVGDDVVDVDIDIDVDGDEEALKLWDVVDKATPSRPIPAQTLQEVLEAVQHVTIEPAIEPPPPPPPPPPVVATPPRSPSRAPSKPSQPPQHIETGSIPTFGGTTNPFQEKVKSGGFGREHSPTPAEAIKAGLRAKMRSGNLKPATVARLLTAFHISQETGEIAFERGGERKVIYLSEGRAVYARSNQDSDRLGAIAKKAFGLTSEQIDAALEIARASDRMIGDVLIEQGLIEESKRLELVREQTRTIIRSLLTWSEGRYVIGFNVRAQIQRAELHEHPASIVLNAIRDQFDVAQLRRLVPDKVMPMPSPNPPYELHELPMGDIEALLLLRSTGARSVGSIITELSARIDERGARAFLYALLLLGVLVAGRAAA